MPKVAVIRCDEYDRTLIESGLEKAIDAIDADLSGYRKILLKPNLVMRKRPEDAATTHPEVVGAMVNLLKKKGIFPLVAESPGGPYTRKRLEAVYETTGIKDVCVQTGTGLNTDISCSEISFDAGSALKKISVISPFHECDGVISMAKFKTHGMAVFTGAVKNLFGLIPGGQKIELHFRFQETFRFMDMLLDLYLAASPVLSVIDGIWAMEGDGPTAGSPRKLGIIIVSQDGIAADYVAAKIIGLKIEEFPLIKRALERGLFREENVEVNVLEGKLEDVMVSDFKIPRRKDITFLKRYLPGRIEKYVRDILTPKPVFVTQKCLGCGECYATCPAKAIAIKNKKAVVDLKRCIRCYCCHELCPEKAVRIKRNIIFETILK
ncbi:DUF362 domain-containing protein [Thermosediminibacter litoriperuensis]|uniref:Ferredoxin n=1 Tax=Thermosediminibacter litoriperuensis TaxID=291989 RepID=A0A5S5AC21_9FIRM|nr:DUF362 domain-containing protein [Thermosediminibacter litoriperuensis]TYP46580.1 uncharacterized protein (DUF362 family) [Thermosediminibacter litoriperuensis]